MQLALERNLTSFSIEITSVTHTPPPIIASLHESLKFHNSEFFEHNEL